ncbi:hypothetical protein F0Q45_10560 [Mycobacterium simiae]|uniref:Uncharacterized protein n=1 Tax=Mycobacterium simiae TaxID=1784 RepID=A0A5B1BSA4_MYCSI|nr:hypothetical protein [Mycobacterium simiae]KAA1250300.1 hypothetical protein F0Q45_10560 [Mycobacterium simiae]
MRYPLQRTSDRSWQQTTERDVARWWDTMALVRGRAVRKVVHIAPARVSAFVPVFAPSTTQSKGYAP